jgi:putative transposase
MPRLARLVIPDVALHVVQRGHDRKACFSHDTDRLVYLSTLRNLLPKSGCALHAFCLMTNHVHLLITPCDVSGPAKLMRDLGQRYVQHFNRRYERRGTLWEGRYYSCLVDSAAYVLACHRYIERNPVRAAMVPSVLHYRWSSYAANAGLAESNLLAPHPEYMALAEGEIRRHAAYQNLLDQDDGSSFLAQIRDATNGGFALLGTQLKAKLVAETGRHLERRKPGPPPAVGKQEADLLSEELGLCPRTN